MNEMHVKDLPHIRNLLLRFARTSGWMVVGAVALCGLACGENNSPRGVTSLPTMPTPVVGEALVSGRIVDGDGQPIPGATLVLAENDATSTADEAGNYRLAVPSDSTLTLMARAAGFASTFRESVTVASKATVTGFDFTLLRPDQVDAFNALGGAGPESTHGLVAVRLHSLAPACAVAGAKLTVWPPRAATIVYSRPGDGGAGTLDRPDPALPAVQAGATIHAWMVGTLPPGSGLVIGVEQAGCKLVAPSPNLQGMTFPGQRHVVSKTLTLADLFLASAP